MASNISRTAARFSSPSGSVSRFQLAGADIGVRLWRIDGDDVGRPRPGTHVRMSADMDNECRGAAHADSAATWRAQR